MSTTRKLTRNFGALSVIQAANFLIPFLALPLIVRVIGTEKFGALNFLVALATYFVLLINYGFDFTATRLIARDRDNQELVDKIFSQVFVVKSVLFGISVIIFSLLLFCVPKLQKDILVTILCFAACFANVFMPNWLFQGMEQLQHAAIFNLVTKLLFSVAMVLLIQQPADYWLYALFTTASQVLAGVLLFFYAMRRFKIRLRAVAFAEVKQVLWTDKAVFISTLLINLYTTSNIVLLGFLQPEKEVGIFTAAVRIIGVVQTLTLMPLSQTLFPHVGRAFAEDTSSGLTEVKKIFPIVNVLAFCISLGLIITAPLAIGILFGAEFKAAVPLLQLLAINPLLTSISNLLGTQVMLNMKKDQSFLWITGVGSVSCIMLNLLLTPTWSYYGTALAWIGTELIIVLLMAVILRRSGVSFIDRRYYSWQYLWQKVKQFKR
ncbi:flippase [Filimonas effusa]|uniref:Flippase n=1 Tax=Filimonas effusa TaxID=2508721 RepID=A0A4Q1D1W2_9BACT|nr:flippase [Filimonas effusa]RXK81865.1 flippase [Filimonas effusa]